MPTHSHIEKNSSTTKKYLEIHPVLFGCIVSLIFFTGFFVQSALTHKPIFPASGSMNTDNSVQAKDFAIFWETWQKIQEAYPFDDQEPSVSDRVYAATAGMVDSFGDPHTSFFSPTETKLFDADVKGEFAGVGMEIEIRDDVPTVVAPLKDSPSEKAGVLPGDVIYKINGEEVVELSIDALISRIRGPRGSSVTITLVRPDEHRSLDVTIVRDNIIIPVIHTETQGDIFVISLYSFNGHATEEFRKALLEFKQSKAEKIIIDLRSNPGGFLESAIDIASMLLPEGVPVVRERGASAIPEQVYRTAGTPLIDSKTPIVVLVDAGSASASEILAGALQEDGRAELVGTTTFGKGSVQEYMQLSDGSALKVTVAKWYTPKGVSISDTGLNPDHVVAYTRADAEKGTDPQMQKARELLDKKSSA